MKNEADDFGDRNFFGQRMRASDIGVAPQFKMALTSKRTLALERDSQKLIAI